MRRPTARQLPLLITALAVLLGVLGMHGASGGTHAASSAQHSVPAHAMAVADQGLARVLSLPAAVASVASPLDGASDLPTAAAMAAVCLAVLLGVAVVLAAGPRARACDAGPRPRPLDRVVPRDDVTRAPPPDLLTRLCVLRT